MAGRAVYIFRKLNFHFQIKYNNGATNLNIIGGDFFLTLKRRDRL